MTDNEKTEYKTLRVPEDAWETAKEQKEAAGRTWGEQIVRPSDDRELNVPEGFLHVMEASDEQLTEIREQLERVPERTADELEGRFR